MINFVDFIDYPKNRDRLIKEFDKMSKEGNFKEIVEKAKKAFDKKLKDK